MTDTSSSQHPAGDGPPAPPPRRAAQGDATVRGAGLRLGLLLGGMALVAVLNIWLFVVIVALLVMIFLHELGHYVTAKRAGMKVTEFFLGFGPKLWSFRRGETEYGVKAIPAGAYVKIVGMHNLEEVDPADEGRTYRQASFPRRLSVAVAGSTMHFALAILLMYVALVGFGMPGGTFDPRTVKDTWVVGEITDGSAAERAGLQRGDDIVSIAGEPVPEFEDLRGVVAERAGDDVEIVVDRDGERVALDATIGSRTVDGERTGFLGVGQTLPDKKVGPVEGLVRAPYEFGRTTVLSVQALGKFFTPGGIADFVGQVGDARQEDATSGSGSGSGSSSDENAGENRLLSIYGLVRIGTATAETSTADLVALFALINIFIGVFNLVPLLPFDGGHVAIAAYERIQEKRRNLQSRYFADVARLLPLTYLVVFLLAGIFVSSLYLDIFDPLGG